jgi:DNA-binding NtrC family response regulator
MQTPVLVIHRDPCVRRSMRRMLEGAEYAVTEIADTENALLTLRESERCMVVLFDVALFNNTLTGADSVAILGAASRDAYLADQRAFVVISPTPENVEMVFGRLLTRIGASIVAEPVNPDVLRVAVARAVQRLLVTA